MNPVWKAVLDQLRPTVPRATFDTWLVNTRYLGCENGITLITCQDDNAREWLADRMTATVAHLLSGILNQSVTVSFVVVEDQSHTQIETEEAAVNVAGEPDADLADDQVQVEASWDSVYEQVVQPEKAIAVNAYFLRHLRQLGPELGWLYIGFRQSAYSAGGRAGQRSARFAGRTVAALSGMSERTFWRRVGSPETWSRLAGLVNLIGEKPLWDERSATPKRLPRKYSVAMTLPLTGADARSLAHWIRNHWNKNDPAGILELACQTPVNEIIPDGASSKDFEPMLASQVVREMLGDDIPEANLKALTERLQMHLMPPSNLVMISLFFVEHVLPHLGAGPGWMLTILRDRCWVSPESGETRNRVTVAGGYAEIAGWLGLDRPLTVYEWLNGKQRNFLPAKDSPGGKKENPNAGKFLNSPLRVYLREVNDQKAESFREGPREFEVLLDEIPQEIMAAIVLQKPPHLYATDSIVNDDLYAIVSIGFTQLSDDLYANDSIALTQLSHDLYANGRVFKLLSSLKPALKTIKTTSGQKFQKSTEAPRTVAGDWNLNSLLRANTISPKSQRRLREAAVNPTAFVSWLLYGYSPAGKNLRDAVGNAISNLLDGDPQAGAGGSCDTLAELGPQALTELLTDSLRGKLITNKDFAGNLGWLSAGKKQELLTRLGGSWLDIHQDNQVPLLTSPKKALAPGEAEAHRQALARVLQNRQGG